MKQFLSFLTIVAVAGYFSSCNDALVEVYKSSQGAPINLSAQLQQQNVTRANDQGFVTGDRMGIYIVDYLDGKPGELTAYDNRANNIIYTYDGAGNRWHSNGEVYWRDEYTPIDVYGYYPAVNTIADVNAYAFEVKADQDIAASDGAISTYEASDFLWGKATKVAPTSESITITYHHQLAGIQVQLAMGTGLTDVEWGKLPKTVLVENTVRTANIDLNTGIATKREGDVEAIRMAAEGNDNYRAVVIPQTVQTGNTLLSLTLDGISYTHTLTTAMNYQAGKLHRFTLTVNKKSASGEYEISVSSDGVTDWVNDESSHDFTQNAYLVVHVPEAGQLEKVMKASFPNYAEVKNLKITGEMTDADFLFIREQMNSLTHINIKSVKLKNCLYRYFDVWEQEEKSEWMDDCLPTDAFREMQSVKSVMLPDSLQRIGSSAFYYVALSSVLVIPEGVTHVGDDAFLHPNLKLGEVEMPYTLEYVGNKAFYGVKSEFKLTDKLSHIGDWAFASASMSGIFYLPSRLEYLGERAFVRCGSNKLKGDIVIPQTLVEIPNGAFEEMKFTSEGITLLMHDGITKIGNRSFEGLKFKSPIQWPKSLTNIGSSAFAGTAIPSPFAFPENLSFMGDRAFSGCKIPGKELIIPDGVSILLRYVFSSSDIIKVITSDNVLQIGEGCFAGNENLQHVHLGKNVEYIDNHAFDYCISLKSITCLAKKPPLLAKNTFSYENFDVYDGITEKCILQVPEESMELYRKAEGWKQFKNITPYKELAFNIPEIKCLDKGFQREGILRAEGAWRVVECPDWVKISPMSASNGQRKWDVTVTVDPMSHTSADREGRIVFQLDGKDYTTYTTVKQYGYEYPEETEIVLQKASAGAPREIPLFLLGEGFDAEEITNGRYLQLMREQMEHFFAIEPYKTYRNYFSVYTAVSRAPETGVSWEDNRFGLNIDYCGDLCGDLDVITHYVDGISPSINSKNLPRTTILLLANQDMAKCHAQYADDGRTVVYCALSPEPYPYDQRGYLQHSLGGLGFGKLGKEYVTHMEFIQGCTCHSCNGWSDYQRAKGMGYYENLTNSFRMSDAPWYDLMFHPRYSDYVNMYEGAYGHLRGMWRSEHESVMNTFIPYFNTVSRRAIVKRIKGYAGVTYSFEDFVANDKIEIPG